MKAFTSLKTVPAILTLSFLLIIFTGSCKKTNAGETPGGPQVGLSDADSLKYLMYGIMQVSFLDGGRDKTEKLPLYYWYDQVPVLDPLSKQYASAKELLKTMTSYPKGPNGKAIDKYSFIDTGEMEGEIAQGVGGDMGMDVTFVSAAPNEIVLAVKYADKNGPAANAGVKRGYQISKINGAAVVYDQNGPGVQKVINALFKDNQATFTFKRQDGSVFTKELYRASYPINPILFDTIFTVSGKKTGYFVFSSFNSIQNKQGTTLTKTELDRVFSSFTNAGISNVIVDLRYNGGGDVETAEYIINKMAPSSLSGKLMYQYKYNNRITPYVPLLGFHEKTYFKNGGNLTLENVFFVTGRETASASELVINSLKPYMSIKLVGDTTYGKPIGFFTVPISIFKNGVKKHLADLYSSNFELVNSTGEGGYYSGMIPNAAARDFLGEPWGSNNDENLKKVFNYISFGAFGKEMLHEARDKGGYLNVMEESLRPNHLNGIIDYKMSEKIKNKM